MSWQPFSLQQSGEEKIDHAPIFHPIHDFQEYLFFMRHTPRSKCYLPLGHSQQFSNYLPPMLVVFVV